MSKTECKAAKDMKEAMEETMQRLQGHFQEISEHLESQNILSVNGSLLSVPLTTHLRAGPAGNTGGHWGRPNSDEMGTLIDHFEKDVAELMTQAGMEEQAISK
ncbi:hypothetical protein Q8A73_000839 [Channa argus]|nr:hypothetical protein Q8A73_000839 [Channa argus]